MEDILSTSVFTCRKLAGIYGTFMLMIAFNI